ncbi:MAG: adenine phosphoribosyltransferase [Solirubrobacteraceae bacterium]|nr:adenine phosphoribosyltransferase [Solirubrobacteraceae bacterium]
MCIVPVRLEDYIRSTPDFPQPGIMFRDFSPLLMDATALDETIDQLGSLAQTVQPDFIVAPEARGFVFGPAIAREAKAGFLPARKPGKLPPDLISHAYDLEYGTAELQITPFEQLSGARVLLHDDLLATGGTIDALAQLATRAGAEVVGALFLIELTALEGRARLAEHAPADAIHALIHY